MKLDLAIVASKLNPTCRVSFSIPRTRFCMIFTTSKGGSQVCVHLSPFRAMFSLENTSASKMFHCTALSRPYGPAKMPSLRCHLSIINAQAVPVALSEGITFSLPSWRPSSPSLLSCSSSQAHPPQRPSSSTSSPYAFIP